MAGTGASGLSGAVLGGLMGDFRFEQGLAGVFLGCWFLALVLMAVPGFSSLVVDITLRHYFGIAALTGWLVGNVYVARRRRFAEVPAVRLLIVYLLGPPGLLTLLRVLAPASAQQAAPLAPVYACGVYAVLFLVPVTLKADPR